MLRLSAGLSLRDIANAVGTSEASVSRWERERRGPANARIAAASGSALPESPPVNREVKIIGAREAAALLSSDYKAVLAALARGDLPGVRVGRTWKISKQAILDLLVPQADPARGTSQR